VTVAEDKVFVAAIDAHTVHALNAADGKPVWSYTVDGRIDSPPTIWGSLALFGSTDGYVYSLRASDGQLVWRFRAAPEDRLIMAYNQLESAWPVHGSVLVQDDVVYFAAGRSSYLDGGIYLYRLNPVTGRQLSVTPVNHRDPKTGEQPRSVVSRFNMTGALPDVLSSDGENIFMRHVRFDREGVQQAQDVPHLFSPAGFLDGDWWHRTYWIIGKQMLGGAGFWFRPGTQFPSGRLIVMNQSDVFAFGRTKYSIRTSHFGLDDTAYRLYGASRTLNEAEQKKNKLRGIPSSEVQYHWQEEAPLIARAMVLANGTLFLAGAETLQAAVEGKQDGKLVAVSAAGGEKLGEFPLESIPVYDGLAVANGRLFMATKAGTVICLSGRE
jgi:outer membrane protein assembly factor BamB